MGTRSRREFLPSVKREALRRQKYLCASCCTVIWKIGDEGRDKHIYGEGAEGHHVIPDLDGGPPTVENCVIICRACHLNAHQAGRWSNIKDVKTGKMTPVSGWADISLYDDVRQLPMSKRIEK